jgi:cytochrome c oxidase subunit 2
MLTTARSSADDSSIEMTASAETFAFTPAKIEARVGQLVTLRVSSSEGVHAIASTDLGIDMTMIRPNRAAMVSFTPQKTGTYVVHCAYVCGIGHSGMAFEVDVSP